MLVALVAGVGSNAVASAGEPQALENYTVAPGDTLWELATTVKAPGDDIRDVVARLERINQLSSADLQVGQTILLPVQ